MTTVEFGELLALAGFAIFLGNSFGRQRLRKTKKPALGVWGLWLRWGDFVAFGLIMAGLWLMWSHK